MASDVRRYLAAYGRHPARRHLAMSAPTCPTCGASAPQGGPRFSLHGKNYRLCSRCDERATAARGPVLER